MSLAHVALLFLSYAQVYTIRIRISTFPPCALNDHAESRVFFNLVADVHKRIHKAFFLQYLVQDTECRFICETKYIYNLI